jgi:hypothetical protein
MIIVIVSNYVECVEIRAMKWKNPFYTPIYYVPFYTWRAIKLILAAVVSRFVLSTLNSTFLLLASGVQKGGIVILEANGDPWASDHLASPGSHVHWKFPLLLVLIFCQLAQVSVLGGIYYIIWTIFFVQFLNLLPLLWSFCKQLFNGEIPHSLVK